MIKQQIFQSDFSAWAIHVNSRWIVHSGLRESTQAYLKHLSKHDASRLHASCKCAYELVDSGKHDVDPKPRFYSGIFSLCTGYEAEQFLQNHEMTRWLVGFSDQPPVTPTSELLELREEVQAIQFPYGD